MKPISLSIKQTSSQPTSKQDNIQIAQGQKKAVLETIENLKTQLKERSIAIPEFQPRNLHIAINEQKTLTTEQQELKKLENEINELEFYSITLKFLTTSENLNDILTQLEENGNLNIFTDFLKDLLSSKQIKAPSNKEYKNKKNPIEGYKAYCEALLKLLTQPVGGSSQSNQYSLVVKIGLILTVIAVLLKFIS